jgi:thiamine-monophosphate kinase
MQSPSHTLGEFALIERFFKTRSETMLASTKSIVILGIGDDCALLVPKPNEELAITSDMLVEGRHFFAGAKAQWLGHKALAVNLSDLAAMGAKPIGFTLALALPTADPRWLEAFSNGLFALANTYSCPLIGGDTTAGPLNICITAFGALPMGKAIRRSGAMAGDDIWVSGTVGDARLALAALRHEINLPPTDLELIENRLHQPVPRVELGIAIRGIATAALDISDGLLGDLKHLLESSHKDAEVFVDRIPKSVILQKMKVPLQTQFAACGGDDYELCFTAPSSQRIAINNIGQALKLSLTQIGSIKPMQNNLATISLMTSDGQDLDANTTAALLKSFDHFA